VASWLQRRLTPSKKKGFDFAGMISRFRAERPVGYLTGEDESFAERERNRGATAVGRTAQLARFEAIRRAQARGLAYSPSTERSLARISDIEAGGKERASGRASDILFGLRGGREQFERQRIFSQYGMEFQHGTEQNRRRDRKQAMFWNSILKAGGIGASLFAAPFTGGASLAAIPAIAGSGGGAEGSGGGGYMTGPPPTQQQEW